MGPGQRKSPRGSQLRELLRRGLRVLTDVVGNRLGTAQTFSSAAGPLGLGPTLVGVPDAANALSVPTTNGLTETVYEVMAGNPPVLFVKPRLLRTRRAIQLLRGSPTRNGPRRRFRGRAGSVEGNSVRDTVADGGRYVRPQGRRSGDICFAKREESACGRGRSVEAIRR